MDDQALFGSSVCVRESGSFLDGIEYSVKDEKNRQIELLSPIESQIESQLEPI